MSTPHISTAEPVHGEIEPWSYWREAVEAGKPVDCPKGLVGLGYYRGRDNEAVAFVEEDGDVIVYRSNLDRHIPTRDDEILELFSWVNSQPVSYQAFEHFHNHGRWPDQIAPVEVSADLAPHEAADAELSAQREAMATWIKEIGKIATQEQATKAGNFADAFAKIETASEEARKTEKQPFFESGKAVDAKWQPVVKRAAELKAYAKKTTEPFLLAERERIRAEEKTRADAAARAAREAEERRRQAEATGASPPIEAPPPLPAPPPAKAKAGKVHLRTVTKHTITDMRAVLEFLATLNDYPAELKDVVQILVNRMRNAGVEVPGVETKQIEVAS